MLDRISVIHGDITTIDIEAIVNAANSSLLGGGGVDGAIHRAGGPVILHECMAIRNRQGSCKVGEAVLTTAGNLNAKYVIHTVGPVWKGGNNGEEGLLANCYRNSLSLAINHGIKSIAFPNISTGVYRFPRVKAAAVAVRETISFLHQHPITESVIFVCYDEENYGLYEKLVADYKAS